MNIQIIPYCKKSNKKKNNEAPIYFVLRINSVDALISTGKYIHIDYFDNEKEKVLPGHQNSMSLNAYLTSEKAKIEKIILNFQNQEKLITHALIKDTYEGKDTKNFIKFAREELKLERGLLADKTMAIHTNSLSNLEKYDPKVSIEGITANYLKRYRAHLIAKGRKKNGYAHDFVTIRKFIVVALEEGLIKKNPFENFKVEWEETYRDHLTEDEKSILINKLPLLSGKLYHTLIYFLIACETGLRFEDMLKISKAWVKGNLSQYLVNGSIFIVQSKGKKPNRIPCSDQALRLFSMPVDRSLKLKSDRIREDLDEILSGAKINKSLNFHCSRHTFAILALEKGVSMKAISQVMGHASIKTTEIYAKYVDKGLDSEMAKLNG